MSIARGQQLPLYCFPYGGAGASCYQPWSDVCPGWLELRTVPYPGRENRYGEKARTRVGELVTDFLESRGQFPESEFCLFGHSLGALVAFETVRELRRRSFPGPLLLAVSGCPAPHLPRTRPRISHLPKDDFFEALLQHFDVSGELIDHPELADLAYPILRADFEAVESYQYEEEEPLDCPILAFGGDQDREATETQVDAWKAHTSGVFHFRSFAGGHFFLHSHAADLLSSVLDGAEGKL